MIGASPTPEFYNHIRSIDLSRDLDRVADLIEQSFPIHLDPDGQTYIREMRKAARGMRIFGWLNNLAEVGDRKSAGFVWEKDGQIVGNLSLIPFVQGRNPIYLIANVAVAPDYRQRGIARALTQHALKYLRGRGGGDVWLQVRDDNPPAISLYRSAGFTEQAVRTTWRIRPVDLKPPIKKPDRWITVSRRLHRDWKRHQDWLGAAYPHELRWNFPVNFKRFEPGCLQALTNLFDGVGMKHWGIDRKGALLGVITWQKSTSFANNLWLAIDESAEPDILPYALRAVLKRVSRRHPLSVDYPAGRFAVEFADLGFEKFRTLIWMSLRLN